MKHVKLTPRTSGQKLLLKTLEQGKQYLTLVFGPTGTGKSLITLGYAINSVIEGKYKRLVITKPIVDVETGREHTIQELGGLYKEIARNYLKDLIEAYIDNKVLEELISNEKIEFADTHYLRGRTFDNTIIFIDDGQNVPLESILEAIARVGLNSRMIIAADPVFQYLETRQHHLQSLRELMLEEEDVRVIDLGLTDIVRPGARKAVKLLLEHKMRKRQLTHDEEKTKNVVKKHAPDAEIVTVIDLRRDKTKYMIKPDMPVPDMLVIVKEKHHGRTIGREGERIQRAEEELKLKLRVAEASLDLTQLIKALHPAPWSLRHVKKIDLEGINIVIKVSEGHAGPLLGQKGLYIKFIEAITKQLLGANIIVKEEKH